MILCSNWISAILLEPSTMSVVLNQMPSRLSVVGPQFFAHAGCSSLYHACRKFLFSQVFLTSLHGGQFCSVLDFGPSQIRTQQCLIYSNSYISDCDSVIITGHPVFWVRTHRSVTEYFYVLYEVISGGRWPYNCLICACSTRIMLILKMCTSFQESVVLIRPEQLSWWCGVGAVFIHSVRCCHRRWKGTFIY